MKKERLKNIELLRFFFAVSIVYFHLLHSFMMPYTQGAEIYQLLADQSRYAKYIVECFFIMSGYFLYRSLLALLDQYCLGFYYQKRSLPVAGSCSVYSFVSCFSGRTLRSGDFESLFSPVHRAYHRLEGAELVCVGFFLCGGFLFSII